MPKSSNDPENLIQRRHCLIHEPKKCLTKEKLPLFYIKSWLLTLIHFPREGEAKWTAGIFCFITHANFIKLVDFS